MGKKRSNDEISTGCRFWLVKKRRYCGRPVIESNQPNKLSSDTTSNQSSTEQPAEPSDQSLNQSTNQYCGHHRTEDKVSCQYCSTLIQSSNQSKHLLICPAAVAARERESWFYYKPSINRRSTNQQNSQSQDELLKEWLKIDIEALIKKINCANQLIDQTISQSNSTVSLQNNDNRLADQSIGQSLKKSSTIRHVIQCQSISSIIKSNQSLNQSSVVIEMGAGTGLLGRIIRDQSVIQSLCLIDNQTFKHKFDHANTISKDCVLQSDNQSNNQATGVKRLKLDIADFWLSGLPELHDTQSINHSTDQSINQPNDLAISQSNNPTTYPSPNHRNVVVVGKHLCGAATDFTIYAVEQSINHLSNQTNSQSTNQSINQPINSFDINGVYIATCCHHRCSFDEYSNQQYLIDHSINQSEFSLMSRMSSWGTLPVVDPRTSNQANNQSIDQSIDQLIDRSINQSIDQSDENDHALDESSSQILQSIVQSSPVLQSMEMFERIKFGQSIKRLIDFGRLIVLEKLGFKIDRIQFIDSLITPENNLCVALKKQQPAT